MIDIGALEKSICKLFCGDLSVKALPSGIAITTTFRDQSSDPVACFMDQDEDGWYLADDGNFLSDTIARGIEIRNGSRKTFLDSVLDPVDAWCDLSNYEIRTYSRPDAPNANDILRFITALMRARDVTFWSQERVKSTFKEDAFQALVERFSERADVLRSAAVDDSLQEFPSDAVLRPKSPSPKLPTTAVFFVQALDTMNEALMLWMEARAQQRTDIRVAALIENGTINLSSYKAQRAFNRIDATAIFRGDERAAIDRIERTALPDAA